MRIANNLSAITAFNSLNATNRSLNKTIQALSTGLRINSASDDAAGFAVSEKMRSQISGLDTALRNAQDGISLLQTAEGALGQTNSMLQRMRELTVQASNDTLTSQDRSYIQLEIEELKKQIDNIANNTQFNEKRILDGSSGALWASSDSGVKARINGGLTYIDQFGQKVSSEGNYRIEIKADPGQAQVQKSSIISTVERIKYPKGNQPVTGQKIVDWNEEILIEEKLMNWSIAINGGDNGEAVSTVKSAPNADEINSGWEFDSSTKIVTIKESGTYHIIGKSNVAATQNTIVIADGVEANIFLEDVNIDVSGKSNACAFDIQPGGKANIFLAGTNTLKSGMGRAGIEVRGAVNEGEKTASVVINSANSSDSSSFDGTLNVTGGFGGAAIGGPGNIANGMSGSIEINGGTIIANGGNDAAGIGGGTKGNNGGGTITINGGDVTAISPLDAGIGTGILSLASAADNGGTVITITGGRVKAKGGGGAGAGIGGGLNFGSGDIKVKSGITIIESEPVGNFLSKCAEQDINNSGSYVFAVKGANDTAAIGHGRGASDTPGGINLAADLSSPTYPLVPDLPSATVKTPATILTPIYDEVIISDIEERHTVSKLSEIPTFYNTDGVCLVSQPKTLTISQGNGKVVSITLYSSDTMQDVADKINNVISNIFGNSKYTNNPNKFCTIADGTDGTSESVYDSQPVYDNEGNITGYNINATMLIRSAIPGKEGELHFSGDDDLLNALGLNTIQESSETRFTASIYDAHTGKPKATGIHLTGNVISGVIPNVDIEFDAMAGINSTWNENSKRYFTSSGGTYSALLHLKDNSITFQTGANKGEDFTLQLGDISCNALGISNVNAVSRETAARSIGVIDRAINKISSQRAKIGAFINGLEHTMENLTTTNLNLTSAESRIRDADMAQTMMEFVKLQVLNQSGTSMLAQANQLPQSVLSLLGN